MSGPYPYKFGTATVSLGDPKQHSLPDKLREAAAAGFHAIDLFDECWEQYLKSRGQDPTTLWDATPENLRIAAELGDLVKSLGMEIVCTQPLRKIEGHHNPNDRKQAFQLVAKRFPFMRAFDTDLVFMCSSIEKEPLSTLDYKTVAQDLRELGLMAEQFSIADGGRMLKIGYEGLSWAQRNTWASSWEVVRAANRHNVGLVLDTFNLLAVEFADPYNPMGHGRIYPTLEESLDVLRMSLASLVATVPGERIFMVQVGDAELMDPKSFQPPMDPDTPALLPWSRRHRLYPLEFERGAYMPVDLVTAAIMATGYEGAISLEIFTHTLFLPDRTVPESHAKRGIESLAKLLKAANDVAAFWGQPAQYVEAYRLWKAGSTAYKSICA